jgi:hypothetical protein
MSVERVSVPAEDGITNTPAANPKTPIERPAWLPDNFETPEAWRKSHDELRADHTKKSQELAELKKTLSGKDKPSDQWKEGDKPSEEGDKPKEGEESKDEKPVTIDEAKMILPGFTEEAIAEISNYAWEHGELTPDHYAKLAEAGYSKAVVDQFMTGQFAVVEGQRSALINAGGGEERVQHMFQWAAQNLDKATIKAYDAKFDAGGPDALMAMENLKAKYEASGVALPSGGFIKGGANANGGNTDVFRSSAQVQEAMSDPRYKTDPAYRKDVEEKLGRSNVF